ncbi:hypothetical protein [Asinibacterium sp. OR53]|uniref:hypothetical protein n=1 Tax=Asinibacterium sp. OR53 TaxID=925409 RepID=UPI0004B97AB2|nr:hypothetical protein [Asinibacterium sp. OR53]
MPDRSFEQQVREELADLKIQPDAASWEVVAGSLQRERKRRWVLWLFLLAICCGGSWIWWEFQTKKAHEPIVNKQRVTTHGQRSNTEETATNKLPEEKETVREIEHQQKRTTNFVVVTGEPGKINMPGKIEGSKPATQGLHIETTEADAVTAEKNKVFTATVLPETTTTDTAQARKPPVTSEAPTATKEKVILARKKKWQIHLFANAGSSGVRNSILRTHTASADMYYSLPGSNFNNGSTATPTPPAFHDAFSFNLGVEFNKAIGKKNSLGVAIGYGLYQDYMNVGARQDSILGGGQNRNYSSARGYYYRNVDSMKYTNRYHFLEASAHLYTLFKLFHVVPFRWELGAGVGVLLGSNGLHYDRQSNFLFSNNDLIRKLNLDISTGFDVGLGKQPFLYVGPQAKFFITNLSRQEGTKQYLWQPSLRAVYVFPQRK